MSEDSKLQESVLAELKWEPSVTAAHIGVTARNGVVTLTGHVQNFSEKHAAEMAACRVKGVKAVAEEIEVHLPAETQRSDEHIAAAAIERLAWNVSVPRDSVKVKVEKGWVTLSGQVHWNFQKIDAEQDLHRLCGVVGVSNQVTVKPKVDAKNIGNDIQTALHRSWYQTQSVGVDAEGSKVRLSGTVHSPYDRQVAATTAWSAPGVTAVENDIAVI